MKLSYVIMNDLISSIATELITAYEKNVLGGQSLRALNEELKKLPESTFLKRLVYPSLLVLSVLIGLALTVVLQLINPLAVTGVMSAIPVCLVVYHKLFVGDKEIRTWQRRRELEGILQEFLTATLGLHDPYGALPHVVTTHSIIESYVGRAMSILFHEKALDRVCDARPRSADHIESAARDLRNRRKEFEYSAEYAAKFGVEIKASEVFSAAHEKAARLGL